MSGLRQYAVVTAAYWAFTLTDLKVQGEIFRVTDPVLTQPVRQVRVQMQVFF